MGEDDPIAVTRFEWSVRCHKARFANMRYVNDYTWNGFLGILNYATLKWGSLKLPQEDANHKDRWPLHPLWADLRQLIDWYNIHYEDLLRPSYELRPDVTDAYLNAFTGWVAGLQARLGIEQEKDGPASLAQTLAFLHQEGHTPDEILKRANVKWEVLSRLARGDK